MRIAQLVIHSVRHILWERVDVTSALHREAKVVSAIQVDDTDRI